MANRYATKSGNWSDPTVWDGGTLPGAGDVVRANGQTVTIDQDVTVTQLRTDFSGSFNVESGTRTITGDLLAGDVNAPLMTVAVNATLAIVGNVTGGPWGSAVSNAGTLTITGNVTGGTVATAHAVYNTGACTLTGNASGGPASSSAAFVLAGAAATLTIHGDVTATNSFAITAQAAGETIDVEGVISAGVGAAISAVTGVVVRVAGTLKHGVGNIAPISAPAWMVKAGRPMTWIVKDDSASPATGADLTLTNAPTGYPDPADVREGVTYGAGGSIVGTLDTAGNSFALADVASVVGAQIAAAVGG